jgi:ribosome-associated toxin RatA of RatAB toxin-antitoxin module
MRVGVSALLLLGALSPGPASADEPWWRPFERGEILVYSQPASKGGVQEVVLKAVIDAPPSKVWAIVSRCNDFTRTMPRITASREISRRGDRVVCSTTVDMPFPYSDMTSVIEAVHRVEGNRWSRCWRLLSGDYKHYSGSWELRPFRNDAGRTFLVYRARVLPEAWIPGWIRRAAQKRSLPNMIKKFRRILTARQP